MHNNELGIRYHLRDHPFKISACLGGGVSPWADGQKVTVHKDRNSLHKHFAGMPIVGR